MSASKSMQVKDIQVRTNRIVQAWQIAGMQMLDTEQRISKTQSGSDWITSLVKKYGDNIFATESVRQ